MPSASPKTHFLCASYLSHGSGNKIVPWYVRYSLHLKIRNWSTNVLLIFSSLFNILCNALEIVWKLEAFRGVRIKTVDRELGTWRYLQVPDFSVVLRVVLVCQKVYGMYCRQHSIVWVQTVTPFLNFFCGATAQLGPRYLDYTQLGTHTR